MGKKYWIKSVIALAGCVAIAGCTKNENFQNLILEQYSEYFKAVVLGNKTIDSYQDWSTVSTTKVEVSVSLAAGAAYTVYIYQTPPLLDADSHYLGMARLQSGQSKTIAIAKPANVGLLYAACYDASGHAFCKPFVAKAEGSRVEFGGEVPYQARTRSTGNDWSVPAMDMPSLTRYTSGSLTEMTVAENDIAEGDTEEKHLKVSETYRGVINRLNALSNQSVYVTGTWSLNYDQYVNNGSVIVVGSGGRINVPRGYKLSTAPYSGTSSNGFIYVMPGGEISGEGTIEITNSESQPSYNQGTISIRDVLLSAGTLYNAGLIGSESDTNTRVSGESADESKPGQLINQGRALLRQTSGDCLAILNGANLHANILALSSTSRLDDGSYTECNTLTLNGSSNGGRVVRMGNGAYLNCVGNIHIDNFGIWGPTGSGYKWNAILKVNNCTLCNTTDGQPSTYLLDHVELILPEDFPTIFTEGALRKWDSDIKCYGIGTLDTTFQGYQNILLLQYWMNGYQGTLIETRNYHWALVNDEKYNFSWNGADVPKAVGVSEERQTCVYALSPSYSTSGSGFEGYTASFSKQKDVTPECNWVYYAFEIGESNSTDFDFNDLVIRLGAPTDNNDGTFTSTAEIVALGTTKYVTAMLNGEQFGNEAHVAIGTSTTANDQTYNRLFRELSTLTYSGNDFQLENLGFTLYVTNEQGVVDQFSGVEKVIKGVPTHLVISGDADGKWFWPKEKMNIGVVYPQFGNWVSDPLTGTEWYSFGNVSSSERIISY